jgi:DNA helicase II / ATP-dependent DNA helicase PcrA
MTRILDGLNEAQRAAVAHIDGPLLTLAGPGSGKTRVVTHRIAYLLEQGISPYSILALTFTNKAALEMKQRVVRIVGQTDVWMGTFHGYCARFLRRYGEMVGLKDNFTIFDADDAKSALEEAIDIAGVSLTHLKFPEIAKSIGQLKNRAITPEMLQAPASGALEAAVRKIYPAYQKFLVTNNAVDFDDLLMHTATILRTNEDLRADLDAKHEYVLVDEYQDTNLAQYLIVRGLSLNYPNINVTGDPDQSIYGWRGADIGNILNFERDYPNVATVRLEENYRSTPEILSVADCLISCNVRRKAKRLIPTLASGQKVKICSYGTAKEEADDIGDQIVQHVLEGTAEPKDFAVLYRTNAHSRLFEQSLMRRKIPYQLIGGFRFYQRQEIRDLVAYLRLVNNPEDDVSFRRVVNVPPRGLGEKSLQQVTELARTRGISMLVALRAAIERGMLSKKALSGAKKFLEVYDRLVHLSSDSIVAMLEYLLKATDYVEYLSGKKGDQEDDSVQSNVQELLADAEEKDSLMSDGEGLQQFLEQISLASDTDQLKSDNRVTLMTLHAAKGLEFDNVYIIAVEQDVLPHMRSKQDPAQMEEERRLFFVGITRAKQTLQISTASSRGFGGGKLTCPSPFLLELPRAEMTIVDKTMRQKSSRSWGSEDLWGSDWKSEDEWSQDVGGDDFEGMDQGMDRVEESDPDESQPLRRPVGSDKEEPTEWVTWDDSDADANRPFVEPSYVLPNPPVRKNKGGGVKGGGEKSLDPPKENPVSSTSTHAKTGKKLPPSLAGLKSGAELTAATTLAGIPVDFFESGTRITHPRYGLGFILSVDGFGPKRMAKIEFDNGDTKSFQLSKSPIDLP